MQHQAHSDSLQVLLQQPAGSLQLSAEEEQALVCSLLCCSQGLGRAVHSTCADRLHGQLPRSSQGAPTAQQQQPSQSRAAAYCRWLSKHARLLHSLQLSISSQEEPAVAAGLKQAAAVAAAQQQKKQQKKAPSLQQPEPRVTRSRAAAAAAAAAPGGPPGAAAAVDFTALAKQAAAAAAAAAAGFALSAGPLQLAELHCCSPVEGSLLHSLAGSQLSRLQLTLAPGTARCTALAAGLASLTGLRQLSLAATAASAHDSWATAAHVASVASGLSRLSQLTQLQLSGWVLLDPADTKQLPRSLASLSIAKRLAYNGGPAIEPEPWEADFPRDLEQPPGPLDLAHLTSLTRLELAELWSDDQLPLGLLELHLDWPYDLAVGSLTKLQLLAIKDAIDTSNGFEALLPGRLPASVTEVRLSLTNPFGTYGGGEFTPWPGRKLDYFAAQLTSISQLRQLHLRSYILQPGVLSRLGCCSQLTSLVLRDCVLSRSGEGWCGLEWSKVELLKQIKVLATQLCQLQALQHLELDLTAAAEWYRDFDDDDDEDSDGNGEQQQQPSSGGSDGTDGGNSRLCAADLDPLVDAICSLSNLQSLRVAWRDGYKSRPYMPRIPALSAEQQARLAAVAPAPPPPEPASTRQWRQM